MHGDGGYYRFFSYLPLFVFSMLMLVLADNFLLIFVFWEAVGLCSYLLIGYYFKRRSADNAAKKAFIVNRIGDLGFGLGIMLIFADLRHAQLLRRGRRLRPGRPRAIADGTLTGIALLLFTGAMRQERPVPAPRLVAGRDGRPDAGLGADPRRDDGHRRHLHGRPLATRSSSSPRPRCWSSPSIGAFTAFMAATIAHHPERHQAGRRLLDRQPARLHGLRPRHRRLGLRHLPPDDARLLQGAALPRLRQRHPRHARGAEHPEDGRPAQVHADHLLDLPDRRRWPTPASSRSPGSGARTRSSSAPGPARSSRAGARWSRSSASSPPS